MSWRRGQPYSQDLRDRVMAAVDGGMGVYKASPLFKVSVSYIYKAQARRRRTGETTARPQRCQLGRKLAAYHDAIRAEVSARPDMTIDELRAWLLETHGVSASQGGMWNTLERLGLTLKKRRATLRSRSDPTLQPHATPGANVNRS